MAFSMFMYRVPRGTFGVPFRLPSYLTHLRNRQSTSTSTSTYLSCLSSRYYSSVQSTHLGSALSFPTARRSTIFEHCLSLLLLLLLLLHLLLETTIHQYESEYIRDKTIINRHQLVNFDHNHRNSATTSTHPTNSTTTMKKSPLTPSTIPPPSINRQHSYTSHSTNSNQTSTPLSPRPASTDPRNILSQVASRAASPRRTNSSPSGSPYSYNSSPPVPESPSLLSTMERRRSWEDCVHQRDGYISFPDFDQVHASASGR